MAETQDVTYTTASAFHGLGLSDADDLQVRADLIRAIGLIVQERKLTQAQAAKVMAMDQPRVSALLNGKINLFSTDRLLRAVRDLGQDVELRLSASDKAKGNMRVAA
jgi:predicted XRE-type DNA-binding protein